MTSRLVRALVSAVVVVALATLTSCPTQVNAHFSTWPNWARYALVGDVAFDDWETKAQNAAKIHEAHATGVTVIEADNRELSCNIDEHDTSPTNPFNVVLDRMTHAVESCKDLNIAIVAYYPSLEVLSRTKKGLEESIKNNMKRADRRTKAEAGHHSAAFIETGSEKANEQSTEALLKEAMEAQQSAEALALKLESVSREQQKAMSNFEGSRLKTTRSRTSHHGREVQALEDDEEKEEKKQKNKKKKGVVKKQGKGGASDKDELFLRTPCDDHHDWVQKSIKGKAIKFTGNDQKNDFWIGRKQTSCWLSPWSPWKDLYNARVKKLSQTGLDGVWVDVPILTDDYAEWSDASPYAADAFQAETGLTVPDSEDWASSVFRKWLRFRHIGLANFLRGVAAAGREANEKFKLIIEVNSMDFRDATTTGMDAAYLKTDDGITIVSELSVNSQPSSMTYALIDDWFMVYSQIKYGRGVTGNGAKPAWIFSYGHKIEDAEVMMAMIMNASCNPYEIKSPFKGKTVDPKFRKRYFNWAKTNEKYIFDAISINQVAVLHSSSSRDYVLESGKGDNGSGALCTTEVLDEDSESYTWWSKSGLDSCYTRVYIGEYRGTLKFMMRNNVPFDVVTLPNITAEELHQYKVIVAPYLVAVDTHDMSVLMEWVEQGGTLVLTGADPLSLDENGIKAVSPLLFDVEKQTEQIEQKGSGVIVWHPTELFKEYLKHNVLEGADVPAVCKVLWSSGLPVDSTPDYAFGWVHHAKARNSNYRIIFETKQLDKEIIVGFVNLNGAPDKDGEGSGQFNRDAVKLSIVIHEKHAENFPLSPLAALPKHVKVKSPDFSDGADITVPCVQKEGPGSCTFEFQLTAFALAVIQI